MRYSLRSLMIGITLFCVVLAGVMVRVQYLRRMKAFHDRQEQLSAAQVRKLGGVGHAYMRGSNPEIDPALDSYIYHRSMSGKYERAVYRPWLGVDETRSAQNPP